MKRIYTLLFALLLLGSIKARPLNIEFYEMIERSKLIVIANSVKPIGADTYEAASYEINIVSIIKGKQIVGAYKVNRAQGSISIPEGIQFIAFINQQNGFEWYAIPTGKDIKDIKETDILSMAGFYDYNAYLVSPSTITLKQLKEYIKTKKYSTQVSGNLYCFSNSTKKMEPSTVQISIDYTYYKGEITSTSKINGLTWKGFTNEPELSVSAWDQEIDINYETNGYRGFTIKGEILPDTDVNGNQQAIFWVTEPQELTFEELNEYLNNDINGFPCYEIEVVTDKNETYTMMLGEEMGRIGWTNYNGKNLGISSYNIDPYWPREIILDYDYYNKLVIKLDSVLVTVDQVNYTREKMVRELKIGPIKGSIVMRNAKKEDTFVVSCELKYKATHFTKNINYGK